MKSWRPWLKVTRGSCTSSKWFMKCGQTTHRYKQALNWIKKQFEIFRFKNVHFKCACRGLVNIKCLCCVIDDRSVGGQDDSDTDRGLCCCRQLALLSGHGSRVHQVRYQQVWKFYHGHLSQELEMHVLFSTCLCKLKNKRPCSLI